MGEGNNKYKYVPWKIAKINLNLLIKYIHSLKLEILWENSVKDTPSPYRQHNIYNQGMHTEVDVNQVWNWIPWYVTQVRNRMPWYVTQARNQMPWYGITK